MQKKQKVDKTVDKEITMENPTNKTTKNSVGKSVYKHKCAICNKIGWIGGRYENENSLPVLKRLFIVMQDRTLIIKCERCLQ